MTTGVQTWSQTAATNATADSAVNWAEGQAPSTVNDSARGLMASVAKWRDDNNGSLVGTLVTATYSVTSNQVAAALTAGYSIAFQLGSAMPATALFNLDSLGAKPLRPYAGTDFVGGEYKIGSVISATYFASNSGEWIVKNPNIISSGNLSASSVTYAKLQNETTNTLLGNVSGGSAAPEEVTIGAGLTVSGTTLNSAFPPSSSYKNLSIKVASNTTVAVAADFVTTTDGTTYQTTAFSSTVNLATTGADALDTGTIAIDTWYYIFAIAKSDGTSKCLASTSATAPTMPTGYTFKARIGAVRTIHGSATLYGTWQLGRRAQYVVGLAQTTALPTIASGAVGTISSPLSSISYVAASVSAFVPTTASTISLIAAPTVTGGSGGTVACAPNGSYGALYTTTTPPLIAFVTANDVRYGTFLLESTNVYWAGSTSGCGLLAVGWEDNI